MGVHGLWRLIEPSGKPVPLESLENKILAVDISIWLHQAVKGFQDARGAPLPNAHLLGIYHRLCKLLYFRIKPVFIFDGGVPFLKKQTIAKRNQQSTKIRNDASSVQQKILSTLLRHSAIQKVISEGNNSETSTNKNVPLSTNTKEDMFRLPELPNSDLDTTLESDTSDTESSEASPVKWDLHSIDAKSTEFTSLPAEVRHDILTDLKEQRKQSSWGRLHELPKQSGDFSSFQMKRLLKRYAVQVSLEEAQKEMGGHTLSLTELETLLTEEGIVTASKTSTKRIASDENKRYLLITDVKRAMEQAKSGEKIKEIDLNEDSSSSSKSIEKDTENSHNKKENSDNKEENSDHKEEISRSNEEINISRDKEYERDLQAAIQLSLQDAPSTSKSENYNFIENFNDADFDSCSYSDDSHEIPKSVISAAQRYMLEYSDLTPYEINKIINKNDSKNKKEKSKSKLMNIIEENTEDHKEKEQKIILDINEKEICLKTDEISEKELFKIPQIISDKKNNTETQSEPKPDIISLTSDSEDIGGSNKPTSSTDISIIINKINIANSKILDNELKPVIQKQIIENHKSNIQTEENRTEFKETNNFEGKELSKRNLTDPNLKLDTKLDLNSDSDEDFVEVINSDATEIKSGESKKTVVELMSDSDDSDLIEIKNSDAADIKSQKESVEVMSDSDESDLVEVKKYDATEIKLAKESTKSVELISDSDDSDFEEVEEKSSAKPGFSIVINRDTKLEDDLFDDIFNVPSKTESHGTSEIKEIVNVKDSKNPEQKLENITTNETTETVKLIEDKVEETSEITDTAIVSVKERKKDSKPKLTMEELNKLQNELAQEQKELTAERNAKERMASDITGQMYLEAQELLEMFGVPYIVAPMEAEAQCAFLNAINLTDGTITDDSDIWLFGGQTVYKNFFNQKKHVLEYRAERIKQYFKLSREQMILLALLVGSDYTVGIQGIGPVTALEILAAFPPAKNIEISFLSQNELITGLTEFKHWLLDGRSYGPGRTTLRSKLQNINIMDGFPNLEVVRAYLQPEVETSKDTFSWGKPDIVGLVDFAREKFGWTRLKTEEILKPIIKKIEDTGKQKSIRDYFGVKHKIDATIDDTNLSKRVKIAINKMGKTREELKKEEEEQKKNKGRKRRVNLMKLSKDLLTDNGNNEAGSSEKPTETKKVQDETVSETIESNVVDTGLIDLSISKKLKTAVNKLDKNEKELAKEDEEPKKRGRRKKSVNLMKLSKVNENNETDSSGKPTETKNVQDETVSGSIELNVEDTDFIDLGLSKRIKTAINKLNKNEKEVAKEGEEPKKRGRRRRNLMELTPDLLKEDSDNKDLSEMSTEIKISNVDDINLSATTSNTTESQNRRVNLQKLKESQNSTEFKKKTEPKPKVQRTRRNEASKEEIPQRERDKINALKTKLRAIEVYRKSKIDKSSAKKKKNIRQPKEDAGLSESSDSS